MKRRAVLICPGRGTYNAPELGYLHRHHKHQRDEIAAFDALRVASGLPTLTSLDGASEYNPAVFTSGSNASGLIFGCGYLDSLTLSEDIDVVAVTGNSMGWYTALSVAGALSAQDGFRVADTMGQLMQAHLIGGQVVYPITGDDWKPDSICRADMLSKIAEIGSRSEHVLTLSIDLGGMLVIAGNAAGLAAFENSVPAQGVFPLRLQNHAAFHSHLQAPVAAQGAKVLAQVEFSFARVPMIDGFGRVWWPQGCDLRSLKDYTLGAQVTRTYDFAAAIRVAAREFAPDLFIVLGPGTTLGGSVAQSLIAARWRGMETREDFVERQESDGLLVAMGRSDQRHLVSTK